MNLTAQGFILISETTAKVKCTYRQTALLVSTQLGPEGDIRNRRLFSVVVKSTEMHIPPWYWFSGLRRRYFHGAAGRV